MRLRAQKEVEVEVEVEAGGNPPNQVLITVVIEIKVRFKLRRQQTDLCGQLCRVNERGLSEGRMHAFAHILNRWGDGCSVNTYVP